MFNLIEKQIDEVKEKKDRAVMSLSTGQAIAEEMADAKNYEELADVYESLAYLTNLINHYDNQIKSLENVQKNLMR